MGRTLLALQVLFRNLYFVVKFLVTMPPKIVKRFPDFVAISSHLHLSWKAYHKRTLENHKIGHKKLYWKTKKTTTTTLTACLAESTLGICIRTSISWQCKLLSKELWICFANEHIPINTWGIIIHGLYFWATTFFQSGIFNLWTSINFKSHGAVLVLIKSHSTHHSVFGLLKWLILQTMETRNHTLLLRLLPLAHGGFSLTGTCSWNDAVFCSCDMSCHTPGILVHHVLFHSFYI